MSSKLIYFSLSHFNQSIRNFFLQTAGYNSQLDYELTTDNLLFEIWWNSKTKSFGQEASSIQLVDVNNYIRAYIPMYSLTDEVKDYIWKTYLEATYKESVNFDAYLAQTGQTPSILVYIPIRGCKVHSEEVKPTLRFFLNPTTHNSYVVVPTNGIKMFKNTYPERFGKNGWNIFNDERVCYYSKQYDGFIVSKKYKNDLMRICAV